MKIYLPVILIFFIISCTTKNSTDYYPEKIVIGIPYSSEASFWKKLITPMGDYLKKTLHVKSVDIFTASDYATVIEAMKAKKVDIAYFGELSYIIAHEKAGAEAMVMFASKDGSALPTNSIMITYPGSGITSMDDVKRRSHELTIVFADPASTSGHLYPRDYLNSIGLEPEKSFKQVVFSQGHAEAILSIKAHKADIACTGMYIPAYMVKKGKLSNNDYVIIWKSVTYPSAPLAIREDLPEDFKMKVKKAYLDFPSQEPDLWKKVVSAIAIFYPKEIQNKIIYAAAVDSIYNPIRRIAKEMPYTNFTNK